MRFLSPEWLVAVQAALRTSPEVAAATTGSSFRLLQVVTGGPEGDVSYLMTAAAGTVDVGPAPPDAASDVTLATTWETAVGITTGAVAPHDAFTTGRLVVRGDIDVLRAQASALAGLSAAFDEIRSQTTYD